VYKKDFEDFSSSPEHQQTSAPFCHSAFPGQVNKPSKSPGGSLFGSYKLLSAHPMGEKLCSQHLSSSLGQLEANLPIRYGDDLVVADD
jgi:hypothetical protein